MALQPHEVEKSLPPEKDLKDDSANFAIAMNSWMHAICIGLPMIIFYFAYMERLIWIVTAPGRKFHTPSLPIAAPKLLIYSTVGNLVLNL